MFWKFVRPGHKASVPVDERSVCGKDHCSIQRRGLKVIGNVYRLDWHKFGLDSPHPRSLGFKLPQAVVYLCPVASPSLFTCRHTRYGRTLGKVLLRQMLPSGLPWMDLSSHCTHLEVCVTPASSFKSLAFSNQGFLTDERNMVVRRSRLLRVSDVKMVLEFPCRDGSRSFLSCCLDLRSAPTSVTGGRQVSSRQRICSECCKLGSCHEKPRLGFPKRLARGTLGIDARLN